MIPDKVKQQRVCQRCGQAPDFRGLHTHHVIHKKSGGRHLHREHWRNLLPFGVKSETIEEVEESEELWCARCHIDVEHSGAQNVRQV